jgi:4a-hydroxytetrahydrobiopterin dehydratase
MLALSDLLSRRCRHLDGTPMSDDAIERQRTVVPEWRREGAFLKRGFRFSGYPATMAFVNAVAALADAEDHHPELHVTFDRCEVAFNTHSVGGLSENDFICAAKVDALATSLADLPACTGGATTR